MNNNLIYNIGDKPKTIKECILYSIQMLLAVFVATVLIAQICGTPISSCLLGAGIGTLIYQFITKFKSPMFISSSGATVSAVCGAMILPSVSDNNYLMVAVGGIIIAIIYCIFAIIIKLKGINAINKIFPATIVGSVTMVIGLNLAGFIKSYVNLDTNIATASILIAIFTMLIVALSSHYFKGFLKTIPFLLGLACGYLLALIITWCGIKIVDFSAFNDMTWYPNLVFLKWYSGDFSWSNMLSVVLLFVPVSICALLEHYSDHKTLGNIIETDLTVVPGLDKTLMGDGIASAVGTILCGLPNTSYGESVATIGFSKVASTFISTLTALILIVMSFIGPVSAFVQTIPSCVFGGCAMILYGFISASGLKTLINNKIDLNNNKNLIIISVILTVGVSGIWLFNQSFAGISLAMVLGVLLNIVLKNKKNKE